MCLQRREETTNNCLCADGQWSRNRDDEGIVVTNSPRRPERSDAMALTEQQATMFGGLQMQTRRLLTLEIMAQKGTDRQARLGETASDIDGSLMAVLAKMDTLQQQHGPALSQHEKTLTSHQYEQARTKSATGQAACLQEQTHGRQLSAEEELAHTPSTCCVRIFGNISLPNRSWRRDSWQVGRKRWHYSNKFADRHHCEKNVRLLQRQCFFLSRLHFLR